MESTYVASRDFVGRIRFHQSPAREIAGQIDIAPGVDPLDDREYGLVGDRTGYLTELVRRGAGLD